MSGIAGDFDVELSQLKSLPNRYSSYNKHEQTRFAILSWQGAGSNLLSEFLHTANPEITMHGQLFDANEIITYQPLGFQLSLFYSAPAWTVAKRDENPLRFLQFVFTGKKPEKDCGLVNPQSKAVGFESFPQHWVGREDVWKNHVLYYTKVKKIVLFREDELAVYVAMKQAEMEQENNNKAKTLTIDPTEFQDFVASYRETFRHEYASPNQETDTFRMTFEQLADKERFETVLPQLWDFLGLKSPTQDLNESLKNMVRQAQADTNRDLSKIIQNYKELELCFRDSDVLHFVKKRMNDKNLPKKGSVTADSKSCVGTWSFLLPICSRIKKKPSEEKDYHRHVTKNGGGLELSNKQQNDEQVYWEMLEDFATSVRKTASKEQLKKTECVVGIDVDDAIYQNAASRKRIEALLPCKAVFVDIQPAIYGKVCRIWSTLAEAANNDFIILLGDDIELLDYGWQERIVQQFQKIATSQGLPFGAACVALKDISYPGFPTFPVLHRWHLQQFGLFLPIEFVNQGGDPYLYELYSRFNASATDVSCRLDNRIGGPENARYEKKEILWRKETLPWNVQLLAQHLDKAKPDGVCLDIVVPCCRVDNNDALERIALLRSTENIYVKFWFVLDNPNQENVDSVNQLADKLNGAQLHKDGNYFVNVIHYGESRGAGPARNFGYYSSVADYVLFLDDNVVPNDSILDEYVNAIGSNPESKLFVGMTELPKACNLWTEMLSACDVGLFYRIASLTGNPPWGVSTNFVMRESRNNSIIQFKEIYPKNGGGADVDLALQTKERFSSLGRCAIVSVPQAQVKQPWWNQGQPSYQTIFRWAWGDALCITEWPSKTFLELPNWIEFTMLVLPVLTMCTGNLSGGFKAALGITLADQILKAVRYSTNCHGGYLSGTLVALGSSTIFSTQEMARFTALVYRQSWFSVCRRFDWFDSELQQAKSHHQRQSLYRFGLFLAITWASFRQ